MTHGVGSAEEGGAVGATGTLHAHSWSSGARSKTISSGCARKGGRGGARGVLLLSVWVGGWVRGWVTGGGKCRRNRDTADCAATHHTALRHSRQCGVSTCPPSGECRKMLCHEAWSRGGEAHEPPPLHQSGWFGAFGCCARSSSQRRERVGRARQGSHHGNPPPHA